MGSEVRVPFKPPAPPPCPPPSTNRLVYRTAMFVPLPLPSARPPVRPLAPPACRLSMGHSPCLHCPPIHIGLYRMPYIKPTPLGLTYPSSRSLHWALSLYCAFKESTELEGLWEVGVNCGGNPCNFFPCTGQL